jgi:2-iminobutanoate/2-iminopropanoate deaminase
MKETVTTTHAPLALGPYAQGAVAGRFLFTAGQLGLEPTSGELVGGGAAAEARRALANVGAILAAAGGTWRDVVKTTVYLVDLKDFGAVNDVYAEFVGDEPPARATVQVAALPRGARVEVEAVAYLGGER